MRLFRFCAAFSDGEGLAGLGSFLLFAALFRAGEEACRVGIDFPV